MFRQLAAQQAGFPPPVPLANMVAGANNVLTGYTPNQLADYLENVWRAPRANTRTWGPGVALVPHQMMARFVNVAGLNAQNAPPGGPVNAVDWRHLIYALMLENSSLVEVFYRIVQEWVSGEGLPVPTMATQRWIRATEELFFTTPRPSGVGVLASNIRPDADGIRRNAYYRMFGMDVLHPGAEGRGARFVKAPTANRDFVATLELLLREAWRGFTNRLNGVGPNNTDDQAITEAVRRLREMLTARRINGMLSREEFAAVATLSWFHLTVEFDTQVVVDLAAQSTSPADRLRRIAERVGVSIHSRADSFFQLAEPLSTLLLNIESGLIEAIGVDSLYLNNGPFQPLMQHIITHWSIVTGANIKESFEQSKKVMIAVPSGLPLLGSGNGSRIPAGRF